ncbi:MAG: cytidine deaminase [Clostridia bacterium]|nr:cytidine deaminase [Clostridia bacterium]
MSDYELMKLAESAREKSYSPYSGYSVGAALLCRDGCVYTGCNIECSTFSPTNCAERTAIFKAVSEGKRDFEKIAVCGGRHNEQSRECTPCGVCRQVMCEFCTPDFKILLGTSDDIRTYTLAELLPFSFSKEEL